MNTISRFLSKFHATILILSCALATTLPNHIQNALATADEDAFADFDDTQNFNDQDLESDVNPMNDFNDEHNDFDTQDDQTNNASTLSPSRGGVANNANINTNFDNSDDNFRDENAEFSDQSPSSESATPNNDESDLSDLADITPLEHLDASSDSEHDALTDSTFENDASPFGEHDDDDHDPDAYVADDEPDVKLEMGQQISICSHDDKFAKSVASMLCLIMHHDHKDTDLHCKVITKQSAAEISDAIAKRQCTFGILEDNMSANQADFVKISPMYKNLLTLIVQKDSPIKSLYDMLNKNIDLPPTNSSGYQMLKDLARNPSVLHRVTETGVYKPEISLQNLCKGRNIDGVILSANQPNDEVYRYAQMCNFKFISLDDSSAAKDCSSEQIPANTYIGQNETIKTIGTMSSLLSHTDTDTKIIEAMRHTLKNHQALSMLHMSMQNMTQ